MSDWARQVMHSETGLKPTDLEPHVRKIYADTRSRRAVRLGQQSPRRVRDRAVQRLDPGEDRVRHRRHADHARRRRGAQGAHEARGLRARDAAVLDRARERAQALARWGDRDHAGFAAVVSRTRRTSANSWAASPTRSSPCSANPRARAGARTNWSDPDARVTRVRIERTPAGRVARGVDFIARAPWKSAGVMPNPLGLSIRGGDTVHVDADRVILCAGTLGSATILLRSGLDDPDIGRGVIAHPAVPVIGRFDERIDAFRGTPATVHVDDFALTHGFMLEAMSAGPQYAAIIIPGTGRQIFEGVRHYGNLAGFGAMLIDEPSRENRVVVNGDGSADIRYELSARDRVRLAFAVEEAARIMFLAGAREVYVPSYELRGDGSDVPGEGFVLRTHRRCVGSASA